MQRILDARQYRAWTDSRANGSKCPYCTNRSALKGFYDLATTHPDLADEWEMKLNDTLLPTDLTASSFTRVWWKGKCGHTWKASVSDRTVRHVRCYKCEAEFLYSDVSYADFIFSPKNPYVRRFFPRLFI